MTESSISIKIFTCLTTHAMHLELAHHDISTDALLSALHKFISRRGFVKVSRSDWFEFHRFRKGTKRSTEAIKS